MKHFSVMSDTYLLSSGILFLTSLTLVIRTTILLVFGILFSTPPILVSRISVVAKPLKLGILFSTSPIFVLNLIYLCCIDLSESYYKPKELFCQNYLLSYLMCVEFCVFNNFFTYYVI